jgi:4-hydroxy-3-polyprenylbenzoate decarboxylase
MRFFVSIGGASGSIYGIRLLQELTKMGHEIHLVVSESAKKILQHETTYTFTILSVQADVVYDNDDLFAGPASGSFPLDGMIVIPCSMKTLSSIAHGFGDTLTSRAASCCLKEGRKVILVLRETPLDLPGITNMLAAKQSGVIILPAMPAFYQKPERIEDLVDFIVGKVFDQLGIQHSLYKRWK